jgi:hypothetical protein
MDTRKGVTIAAGLLLLAAVLVGVPATVSLLGPATKQQATPPVPPERACPPAPQTTGATITGQSKVDRDGLARLRADGVGDKAGLIWRVSPSKAVSRATNPRGLLEFAAPPGTYEIDLLVITTTPDGAVQVEEAQATVTVGDGQPDPPTPPAPPNPPDKPAPKADPLAALGRLRVGNSGCTATIIYPRRGDGKWDVVTAAHCTGGPGTKGTVTLKDGRQLGLTVTARDTQADLCWMVTDSPDLSDLPFAVLADKEPAPGTAVWHSGYGVDKPGNREDGTVVGGPDSNGQLKYSLSVSSGDSGGGIFRTDTGEWLGAVCCTASMARKGSMWAGCVTVAKRLRPKSPAADPSTAIYEYGDPTPLPTRSGG